MLTTCSHSVYRLGIDSDVINNVIVRRIFTTDEMAKNLLNTKNLKKRKKHNYDLVVPTCYTFMLKIS